MVVEKTENLDDKYLEKIQDVSFRPIFILGLPRSGTSILYKILSKTGNFNAVTSYHIIRYNSLIHNHIHKLEEQAKKEINDSFVNKGLKDRGLDKLKISADFSEEYGYILQQHTRHIFIHPDNIHIFKDLAKKIQYISGNNKPLLLKNPFDFQNTIYIKKMFPDAQFIFICRDPQKILSSSMKAIRFLLQGKHYYSTQIFRAYNKIIQNPLLLYSTRLCFQQLSLFGLMYVTAVYSKISKRFFRNLSQHASKDYINIKYEELCNNPEKTINEIMDFLNLTIEEKIDVNKLIKPRKTQMEPNVIKMNNFIYKRLKKYYDFFGYS